MSDLKYRIYKDERSPPGWGVQAIVYEHPSLGWAMATGGDFYIQRSDRWVAVDLAGLLDFVINEKGIVAAGRTISNIEFHEIYQHAKSDRNFANKSGHLPDERTSVEDI